MTPAFGEAFEELVSADRRRVETVPDDMSDAFFQQEGRQSAPDEAAFVDAAPPC